MNTFTFVIFETFVILHFKRRAAQNIVHCVIRVFQKSNQCQFRRSNIAIFGHIAPIPFRNKISIKSAQRGFFQNSIYFRVKCDSKNLEPTIALRYSIYPRSTLLLVSHLFSRIYVHYISSLSWLRFAYAAMLFLCLFRFEDPFSRSL